jgi:pimeloyl-ACP methyl ester carboxylesterase
MLDQTPRPAISRLPPRRGLPLLDSFVGDLVLRPWLDAVGLIGVVRWLFPLSRAWAAAGLAGDSVEIFRAETGVTADAARQVQPALDALLARRRAYEAAARRWEEAVFADAASDTASRVAAEKQRLRSAQAWMSGRSLFLPLHLRSGVPPVKWQFPTEDEVDARHGARLADSALAFPAPLPVAVQQSQPLPGAGGDTSWLRFPTQVSGAPDTAWARVIAPPATPDPPTLIFLHGIGIETEFWAADLGRVDSLVASGIRVIRPEAPWHGRRSPPGWFGGEPVLARGPLGLLDLFAAWIGEVAQLVAWARATSRGPVAIGGISMGALTTQLAATHAASWPKEMQPDAMLLIGTTGDVVGAALSGGLGRALGVADRLAALSWSPPAMQRWAPLLDPQATPVMPPEAIVMLIGTSDTVTPGVGGMALARRWRLPAKNLFLRPQGHFSVALGLERDAAPLTRLAAILRRLP